MRLMMETDFEEFEIEVADDTDLDDRFGALEVDSGQRIIVNGWMCRFSDVEG